LRVNFIKDELNSDATMTEKSDFRLSQIEKRYLRTGDTGSYSEKELQRRIKQKRDNIDTRLQNLMHDVALMYSNGYLDYEDEIESFCDIFNLKGGVEETIPTTVHRKESGTHPEDPSKSIFSRYSKCEKTEEIGYLIGIFLHLLMTMAPEERPWDQMFKGLLMFFIMNPNHRSDERLEKLEELINFNIKDPATEVREMSDVISQYVYYFDYDENRTSAYSEVKNALNDQDIPVSGRLVNYIVSKLDGLDDLLNIKRVTDEVLNELKEDTEMIEIINLCRSIEADESYLTQDWKGPSRIEIIKKRYDPDVNNDSKSIASEITKSIHGNLVTEAINKMYHEGGSDEMWMTYPIFEKTDKGVNFTPYGQLFALYLNGEMSFNNLYAYAIQNGKQDNNDMSEEKLIADVLAQVSDYNE
jgi:hypothetical protein